MVEWPRSSWKYSQSSPPQHWKIYRELAIAHQLKGLERIASWSRNWGTKGQWTLEPYTLEGFHSRLVKCIVADDQVCCSHKYYRTRRFNLQRCRLAELPDLRISVTMSAIQTFLWRKNACRVVYSVAYRIVSQANISQGIFMRSTRALSFEWSTFHVPGVFTVAYAFSITSEVSHLPV